MEAIVNNSEPQKPLDLQEGFGFLRTHSMPYCGFTATLEGKEQLFKNIPKATNSDAEKCKELGIKFLPGSRSFQSIDIFTVEHQSVPLRQWNNRAAMMNYVNLVDALGEDYLKEKD